MKSLLSELIKTRPEDSMWDWRDFLNENYPSIIVTENDKCPYVLFRYSIGCDFKDPLVQEARGIILDKTTGDVVCWPFRKFGKYYEAYADTIDWSSARVIEKIDGSIIKLWYDKYTNKFVFSTNGVIYAEDAFIESENGIVSFMDLIKQSVNYNHLIELIQKDKLDKHKTYIFELVNPSNEVVIHYDEKILYHIGTRNNITGEESNDDIGIIKPKEYPIHYLEECIRIADDMTKNEAGKSLIVI